MKKTFSAKSIAFALLFFSFAFISCNNEEDTSSVAQSNTSVAFKERLTASDKIRTEDMIVFRTQLHEAVQEGQKGNKQHYEDMLVEASTAYLDFNKVAYDKSASKSAVFSKALALYSDRMKKLNPPQN